jgi:hypothetical protein
LKQRIDLFQLQELTPEQQEKLRAWWKPEEGDHFLILGEYEGVVKEYRNDMVSDYTDPTYNDYIEYDEWDKPKCLPMLSIGQCIQLLHEFVKERDNNRLTIWEMVNHLWNVEALEKNDSKWGEEHFWIQDKEELVDALFEAVKSIL